MIEVWMARGGVVLRLPIVPETVGYTVAMAVNRSTLHEVGEVAMAGRPKLITMTLSSYFPAREDANCQYKSVPKPAAFVQTLRSWCDAGVPVRIIVADSGHPAVRQSSGGATINMLCLIESVSFSAGRAPGDVQYDMNITEYRPIEVG